MVSDHYPMTAIILTPLISHCTFTLKGLGHQMDLAYVNMYKFI